MQLNNTFLIDLQYKNYNLNVTAYEGDTKSRYIDLQILNSGQIINLTGHSIKVYAIKPDGTKIYNNCTITDATNGKAELELTSQMLAVAGTVQAQFIIYGTDSSILSTQTFSINVEKSLRDDSAIESTDEFTTLTQGINKLETWDSQFQQKYDGLNAQYASQLTSNTNKIGNLLTNGITESSLSEAIKNDRTTLASHTTQLADHTTKIGANTTNITNLQTSLNITNTNIANNTSTINTHTTQIQANTTAISNIGNASPKGTYATLTALQTAFPTGTTGIYIVSADGKWYYWNGSAWTAGGTYQSTSIADYGLIEQMYAAGSINLTKFNDDIALPISAYALMSYTIEKDYYYTSQAGVKTSFSGRNNIKVACHPGDKLKCSTNVGGSTSIAMAVFFKADGTFLSSLNPGTSGVNTPYTNYEFVAPNGAYFVAIDGDNLQPMSLYRKQVIDVNALSSKLDTVNDNVQQYIPINTTVTSGYYSSGSGLQGTGSSYQCLKVPCNPGDKMSVTTTISGTALAMAIFYKSDGSFLSSLNPGTNGVNTPYTNTLFTVPDNAYYVAVDGLANYPISIALKQLSQIGTVVTSHESRITAVENITNSYWKGKKIVWFGTSIPEGYYDSNPMHSYPQIVATKLGATVYNEAKGSSCVRNGYFEKIATGDADGWKGCPWQNIAFSLSQTLAEKQSLIDNWATWKTYLTNNPPDTLDSATQTTILDCSYENRLVSRHLGTNRADLYVFDHGYNDLGGYTDLDTIPTNSRDRHYFIGAMNYLIDLILTDNPHARILFVGHYENQKNPNVAAGQQKLADYWSFPIIKLWERLGWSNQLITTTGYWNNGIWVSSGGATQQITVKNTWLADAVHPHTNYSGDSTNLIANVLTKEIDKVR